MPFERGLAEISSVPVLLNSESSSTDAKQQDQSAGGGSLHSSGVVFRLDDMSCNVMKTPGYSV